MVYGESFLRWTYGNPFGKAALHTLVKRPLFSAWYGRKMDHPKSAQKVFPFLKSYGLDTEDFEETPESFRSFNEFFFRKLKPAARPIDPDPAVVTFPADGRHLGFANAAEISSVFVKGQKFDLPRLLDDPQLAAQYAEGPLVLSRLCPVDYHRFHFPAEGVPGPVRVINGPLFSVSPIALRRNLAYLWTNRRTVTELDAGRFGKILLLEIGATCVGRIHQTYQPGRPVGKGAEKGYFGFGGSSTITIFESGKIRLAADLLENTARQTELYARIGTAMGRLAE